MAPRTKGWVLLSDEVESELQVLRDIRDLLRPIADYYQAGYDLRQTVRALVNGSPARRKVWDLIDGVLVQKELERQSGMDQGNLSKYLKALRAAGAIAGDPPKRAVEV
jgi:hypothetical protein